MIENEIGCQSPVLGSQMRLVFFVSLNRVLGRIRFGRAAFEPTHVRQGSLCVATHGNQLSRYRDCNFFRRDGADIQTDGCVYALEKFG
jgi:hypothetical protein